MEQALAAILGFALVALIFWVPMEILRKAGYSRWWALLIPMTGFIGLVVFACADWPIHRELAWRRLAAGSGSERDRVLAQRYAIDLEQNGEWQQAIEVYETLSQRSPDKEEAEYAAKCIGRLRESLARSLDA
jgi:hypothetical protein